MIHKRLSTHCDARFGHFTWRRVLRIHETESILPSLHMMALSVTEAGAGAIEAFWNRLSTWRISLELATVCALVASSVVLYCLAQAQQRKRLPPGPRPWPIVGNLFVLASGLPQIHLEKLAAKYGQVMYLRLGSRPCVVVSTAAAAKEITRQSNDANFSSRPKGLFVGIFSDNYQTIGFSPHGPYWRQLRKFSSSELFSPKRHASFQDAREQELRNMMTILEKESAKGEVINLRNWLFELSANVMTRMLINKRYFGSGGASQEERNEIHQLFLTVVRAFMVPVIGDFIPSLNFLTTLQGTDRVLKDIRDDLLRVVGKMMELEKHRERAKERGDNDEHYVPDFVDVISTAPLLDGKSLPDRLQTLVLMVRSFRLFISPLGDQAPSFAENIILPVLKRLQELLVGGTENASTAVEWAMAELVAHPDVMKQAREELDAVVGCCRLMQESDVPNLPFLRAIVKETFRLHPPTTLPPPRETTQAAEVWGYKIPAKTTVFLNLRAIHRDPAVYRNPKEFDPQRFVDRPEVNHLSGFDSFELIPFGVGRRMCPGVNLGNTMVYLMLGNPIHSYDWSLPKDQSFESFRRDNLEEAFGSTAVRKEPLLLTAKPRDHVASC